MVRRGILKIKPLLRVRKRRGNKVYVIIGIVAFIIAIILLGLVTSTKLVVKDFKIEYENLPKSFDGYKIVQLTDYHKRVYANSNDTLIEKIAPLEPDMILLSGDIIDRTSKDVDNILSLCEKLVDVAPVIWIKGNHFYKSDKDLTAELDTRLPEMGVNLLVNSLLEVKRKDESIVFFGLDDPERFYSSRDLPKEYVEKADEKVIARNLDELDKLDTNSQFRILVSHRFTQAHLFEEHHFCLAFAGHSHGGQVKLPGGYELFGESLQIFPKIKSGNNDINGMPLIVSSGLGTSNFDLRLYNPPEVVIVELVAK